MNWVPIPSCFSSAPEIPRWGNRTLWSQLSPTSEPPVSENKVEATGVAQWVKVLGFLTINKVKSNQGRLLMLASELHACTHSNSHLYTRTHTTHTHKLLTYLSFSNSVFHGEFWGPYRMRILRRAVIYKKNTERGENNICWILSYGGWEFGAVVQHLPSKHKVMSFGSSNIPPPPASASPTRPQKLNNKYFTLQFCSTRITPL